MRGFEGLTRGGATLACLAGLLAGATGCQEDPPGIRIDLMVDEGKFRPDYVKFHWLREGRMPFEERLPETGALTPAAGLVGSLFIQTVGPLRDARGLAVQGYRGDTQVSGGFVRIEPNAGARRHIQLVLTDPLPDADDNQLPDVVDCFITPEGPACSAEPVPDAGGPAPVPPDAGDDAPRLDAGAGGTDGGAADASPIEQGLLGLWRFDEGSGNRANDSSGNNHHGTLRGAQLGWVPGRAEGTSLEIPNANNHGVTVMPSPGIDGIRNAFTIAAWIYRTDERDGLANVLSRRSTGVNEHFALALNDVGRPRVYLNSHLNPALPNVTGPDPIPLEQWVHLATTYDGGMLHLYVNGTEVGKVAVATTIQAERTLLCIGCGQNTDAVVIEPLAGRIDDLRLYNRALTVEQILSLMVAR